jgi:HK97 family phage major capsid protein
MKMVLGCGPTTVEIVVLPNSDFPNLEQGIPFIVGDLNEGVALFDRRRVTLMQSKTASVDGYNAFEQGGLLIRADERADYVVRDAAAFVLGYIAI